MLCKFGVRWLLPFLVGCGAFEMYDEPLPINFDYSIGFRNDGYNYQEPFVSELHVDPAKNLMLYKLINALQKEDALNMQNNRPSIHNLDNPTSDMEFTSLVKRPSDALGSAPTIGYKVKPVARKQPKWKKGKGVGSQMVCYFKLCAFRAPS